MIIGARKAGCRLGNRLEQFTHLIAWAQMTGCSVAMPSLAAWAPSFRGTENNPFCLFPTGKGSNRRQGLPFLLPHEAAYRICWLFGTARPLGKLLGAAYVDCPNSSEFDLLDPQFLTLSASRKVVFLASGWQYRCWSGLEAALPAIRTFLSPSEQLKKRVAALVSTARVNDPLLIGVHIRQTDFRTHLGGRYFFPLDDYLKAMTELVRNEFPRPVRFLICSDEAQTRESFAGLDVVFGLGDALGDLFCLASCDRIIGPAISSFSGWAALFGDRPFLGLEPGSPPGKPFCKSPLLRPHEDGKVNARGAGGMELGDNSDS